MPGEHLLLIVHAVFAALFEWLRRAAPVAAGNENFENKKNGVNKKEKKKNIQLLFVEWKQVRVKVSEWEMANEVARARGV